MKFLDEVRVQATAGDGGHGARTFRREKFVPRGGPSGGDGGRGGHVVFEASEQLNTLLPLRFAPIVKAKRGGHGDRANKNGRAAPDRIIQVPVGTMITDIKTGEVVADLSEAGQSTVVCRGGNGGKGNSHFKTSTDRAPNTAEDGHPGEYRELQLELKLLADVGLVGFPNAGKSTLISALSAAKPKVAAYPFTTLEPSLGVVRIPDTYNSFVMADIPGLIEGAADGVGLGHQFLRHVERCKLMLHLVSLDPLEDEVSGPPEERFAKIEVELAKYDPALADRPRHILLSKADLATPERREEVVAAFQEQGVPVTIASAVTGEGSRELIFALAAALKAAGADS